MKNASLIILTTLIAAGCGDGYKKNPIGSDLKTIREQGKKPDEVVPQNPTVVSRKDTAGDVEAVGSLKISNLPTEVTEGEEPVSFTVTATIPGADETTKPTISATYDGVKQTKGNKFLELDGARYVTSDPAHTEPEYLGNSQFKFSLLFDVKNKAVQPQLGLDGSLMTKATGTRVRATFTVSNGQGVTTPATLAKILIRYKKGK